MPREPLTRCDPAQIPQTLTEPAMNAGQIPPTMPPAPPMPRPRHKPAADDKLAALEQRVTALEAEPSDLRALLRKNVTVLGPDDVLVIWHRNLTVELARQIRDEVDSFNEHHGTSVKVMTVRADDISVAAGDDHA